MTAPISVSAGLEDAQACWAEVQLRAVNLAVNSVSGS